MGTVLITGGTGLIGRALCGWLLQKGYSVTVLTRGKQQQTMHGIQYAQWDPDKQVVDSNAIANADYIIHLAGAGVADKRWTAARKKKILESRTRSSDLLVKALKENAHHVKAIISASGIGWYGEDPSIPNPHPFVETDPADDDFLGETCRQWEASIDKATEAGVRVVKIRTGIVLSTQGGALPEFMKPLRFGIAAILGSGKQILSWIHIDDLCRIYLLAMENEAMTGAYNAVAPKLISNKDFTLHLAKVMRKRFYLPVYVPAAILKLVMGQMSVEVLKSTTASAVKVREAGFNFIYPSPDAAINELLGGRPV